MKSNNIFKSLKIHVFMMILVIVCGFLMKINYLEWIACIVCFALVIGFEMLNTAIENAVDLAMPEIHEKAKLAKDVSAGAVLFVSICSVVIGIIIFLPKIIALF